MRRVLVPPEYGSTGVAVLLIDPLARRAAARVYRWDDLSLTTGDNPRMPVLVEHMGVRICKRYRVDRKRLGPPVF